MGRYDKIKYWNGSAWVNPSQVKVWNGSAWVDYGANDSSNTNSIYGYNGSGWQRFTRNKTITNTSTLNYKYLRGPIDGAVMNASNCKLSNAYGYNSGNDWRLYRGFRGYVNITASSANCRIWGVFTNSGYNTSTTVCYDDMLLYTNTYLQYRSKYNSGSTSRQYSYQTMTYNAWHYVNFNSLYLYNGNTSYDGRTLLSIDGGGHYWMRTDNGGSTASNSSSRYYYWNNYPRFGGTSTYYKGTISLYGCQNTSKYTATINIDNFSVGASINGTSSLTTWNDAYTVAGNYTNTSTTSWT